MSDSTWALITTYGVRVSGAALLLFLAWIAADIARRLTRRAVRKAEIDQTLERFFGNLARYTVLLLAVLASLSVFGVETTTFAAILGAAGIAIGLAMQGSLSNFASGVMLLLFRPFKVGDTVIAAGQRGRVDEIQLFTTVLITPDNRVLIIPNSKVFGGVIENVTQLAMRRVDVDVGVDYAASVEQTRAVLDEAIASVDGVLEDPAPKCVLLGLGASAVDWQVRVWVNTDDFATVKERLTAAMKSELDKASIAIPFPQLDVHLAPNAAALSGESAAT